MVVPVRIRMRTGTTKFLSTMRTGYALHRPRSRRRGTWGPGEKTNNEQTGPRPSIHSVYSNVLYVLGSVPHTLNPTPYYLLARGEAWGSLMPYGIHLG